MVFFYDTKLFFQVKSLNNEEFLCRSFKELPACIREPLEALKAQCCCCIPLGLHRINDYQGGYLTLVQFQKRIFQAFLMVDDYTLPKIRPRECLCQRYKRSIMDDKYIDYVS